MMNIAAFISSREMHKETASLSLPILQMQRGKHLKSMMIVSSIRKFKKVCQLLHIFSHNRI